LTRVTFSADNLDASVAAFQHIHFSRRPRQVEAWNLHKRLILSTFPPTSSSSRPKTVTTEPHGDSTRRRTGFTSPLEEDTAITRAAPWQLWHFSICVDSVCTRPSLLKPSKRSRLGLRLVKTYPCPYQGRQARQVCQYGGLRGEARVSLSASLVHAAIHWWPLTFEKSMLTRSQGA